MKKHTSIYMQHFGYTVADFIPCEICGAKANDIHHIEARGSGGDPKGTKDNIFNLMALCRSDHIKFGDVPDAKEWLRKIHLQKMQGK